jgi:hypothetical protein
MQAEQAVPITYTSTYLGREDQVRHVRRAIAEYLAGCPPPTMPCSSLSELASNAILHSASRGRFFTIHAELHEDYVKLEVEDLGGPGAVGMATAARTAWTWSRHSSVPATREPRRHTTADGLSGHGSTWDRGCKQGPSQNTVSRKPETRTSGEKARNIPFAECVTGEKPGTFQTSPDGTSRP